MKKTMIALVPALALLAACGNDNEAAAPVDNGLEGIDVTNEAARVPEAPPPAEMANLAPAAENMSVDDAPPVKADEQVQDDADATGMTARVDRSDAQAADAADDAQAAEGAATSENKR